MLCKKCGHAFPAKATGVDLAVSPELKEQIKDGSFFVVQCPVCGEPMLCDDNFFYHDPDGHLLVVLSRSVLSSDEKPGYTCRRVESVGELIEKINIADAGLDDIAIELCKFILQQEMHKEMDLKFYRMDGPDGDFTFAYPENGEMQMLQASHGLYADALGILARNPAISRAASTLIRVDQGFIRSIFG